MSPNELVTLFDGKYHTYYRYLLLDLLGSVGTYSSLSLSSLSESFSAFDIAVINRPELAHSKNNCPHLICIGRPNQNVHADLMQTSLDDSLYEVLYSKRYISGWLVSEHPPEIVAEQILDTGLKLGQHLNRGFVPFYEPFRMQLLQDGNEACPKWLPNVLGNFEYYAYCDIYKKIREIIPQTVITNHDYIFITDDAKFYEKEAKSLFFLYLTWHDIQLKKGNGIEKNEIMALFQFYYQAAKKWALSNTNDRFIYAIDSLKYGQLTTNPTLKQAILAARDDPGSLSTLFSSIPENEFLACNK